MEPEGSAAAETATVTDEQSKAPRQPGRWAGRVFVADDFDATPEWLIEAFEGS
jgi:hypothetical protein